MSAQRCDGMVALVTGSSRGLGRAIAARLAERGATVALTARTMDPDPKYQGSLSQTRDEIVAAGGKAIAVQADLSQSEDRERLFAEVISAVGAPAASRRNTAMPSRATAGAWTALPKLSVATGIARAASMTAPTTPSTTETKFSTFTVRPMRAESPDPTDSATCRTPLACAPMPARFDEKSTIRL